MQLNIRRDVPSSVYQSLHGCCPCRLLSRLDYGNATLADLTSGSACLTASSLSSTRQLGRSLVFVARSILQMLLPVFTGCWHPSASSSNWRSLSTELFTALHLSTCRTGCSTSLICRPDVEAGCARRPPVSSMSARRDLLLLAIALLLLLAMHDSGTVYLLMFSLPHHSQHFARSWKHVFRHAVIPRHCPLVASPYWSLLLLLVDANVNVNQKMLAWLT